MLSGISRKRSIRSSTCWFTEFCNSQCLSHFAAPFIVVRAETSVAECCLEHLHRQADVVNIVSHKVRQTTWQGTRTTAAAISWHPCPRVSSRGCENHMSLPEASRGVVHGCVVGYVRMILPQVHLRKPCYDFSFL
jgi:hypothetical protein